MEDIKLITGYTTEVYQNILDEKSFHQLLKNIEPLNFGLLFHNIDEGGISEKEKDKTNTDYITQDGDYSGRVMLIVENLAEISKRLDIRIGYMQNESYFYNGKFWEIFPKNKLVTLLSLVAERSGINRVEARTPLLMDKLFKQFQILCYLPEKKERKDIVKINLKNGTFVVDSLNQYLKETSSADMFKYQLPFSYDPSAIPSKFLNFLDEVLPDEDSKKVLAEYLGYIFVRNAKLEKCLVLFGQGANGKSVIYDIVYALLGNDNISTFSLGDLCDNKGYHRAEIKNKLLNYSSELGGKNVDYDVFKQMVSNETITCRSPYGKPYMLKDYCRLMFNANSLPKKIENTPAYFRRLIIMDFNVTIPVEKRNPNLAKEIITTELSGVFNWVLEGLRRLLKQEGFTHSQAISETIQKYTKETNSVALFMEDENYKQSTEKKIAQKSLFSFYNVYCKDNNYRPVSNIEFGRRIDDLKYYRKKRSTNNATVVYCDNSTLDAETESILDKMNNR